MHTDAWPAPAKLNRFLHIVGRRDDGYHVLQTVFQFLDYSDALEFEITRDKRIRRITNMPSVPESHDLVVRAARLLQESCDHSQGAIIRLHKQIPMGGGLGGGSSDAATTLVALNHLWALDLSMERLAELGLQLGADVPVFVKGHSAWAEGVGEKLQVIDLDEPWFCVIVPDIHISTAAVFSNPELTRNTHPIKISDFLAGVGSNDCEAVVCKEYPEVGVVIEWMRQHADHAPGCRVLTRMTGTGACVFAGFEQESQAVCLLEQLPEGWTGFVARGLNRSPLQARLQQENTSGSLDCQD